MLLMRRLLSALLAITVCFAAPSWVMAADSAHGGQVFSSRPPSGLSLADVAVGAALRGERLVL